MTVIAMVEAILREMNCPEPIQILNVANHEIPDQHLDCSKARNLLGWTPAFGFEESLRRTIDWYSSQIEKSKAA